MPNPNMFGGMFGNPGMMQGQQGGAPPVQGGVQGPAPMPQPAAPQPGPALNSAQWMQARGNNNADLAQMQQDLQDAQSRLRQAGLAGAPPTVLSGLQAQVEQISGALRTRVQQEMIRSQQNAVNQERAMSLGGIGGARNPNAGAASTNAGFEQQLLSLMLGGGGGMPGRR